MKHRHGRRATLLTILFTILCAWLLSPAAAEPPTRSLRLGHRRLPYYAPEWAETAAPLDAISSWLAEDRPRARRAFQDLVQNVAGEILLPTSFDASAPPPLTIPASAPLLRAFVDGLADEHASLAAAAGLTQGTDARPHWPSAAPFWHPALLEQATAHFERAVEQGERALAHSWLDAPNRPDVAPVVLEWLADAAPGRASGWRQTYASAGQRSATAGRSTLAATSKPALPPLTAVHSLSRDAAVGESSLSYWNGREVELAPIPVGPVEQRPLLANLQYPLIHADGRVIIEVGSRVTCLDTTQKLERLWEVSAHQLGGVVAASPARICAAPIAGPRGLIACRVSAGVPVGWELAGGFGKRHMPDLIHGSRPEVAAAMETVRWNVLGLLRVAPGAAPEVVKFPALDAALEQSTIVAPPLFVGDLLIVVSTRGWFEVEFSALALDLNTGKIAWRRPLGIVTPQIDTLHYRDQIREARLDRCGHRIVVSVDGGWSSALDVTTGAHLGTLVQDLPPSPPPFAAGNSKIQQLIHRSRVVVHLTGRHQYTGPTLRVPHADGERLVFLPPRGLHLLALQPQDMRCLWQSQPFSDTTCLLGAHDGHAILLDLFTSKGDQTIALLRVNLETGELVTRRMLSVPLPAAAWNDEAIVLGPPQLHGAEVWVPTLTGIAIWGLPTLPAAPPGPLPPTTLRPWPTGSVGGSVFPLPGGGLLTITRGATPRYAGSSRPARPGIAARMELLLEDVAADSQETPGDR